MLFSTFCNLDYTFLIRQGVSKPPLWKKINTCTVLQVLCITEVNKCVLKAAYKNMGYQTLQACKMFASNQSLTDFIK